MFFTIIVVIIAVWLVMLILVFLIHKQQVHYTTMVNLVEIYGWYGYFITIATTNNFLTGTVEGFSVDGNVTTISIYDTAAGDATPLIGVNNVIGSGKQQYIQIETEYLMISSNVTTVVEGATTKYNITGGTFNNTVNVGISTWSICNTREIT